MIIRHKSKCHGWSMLSRHCQNAMDMILWYYINDGSVVALGIDYFDLTTEMEIYWNPKHCSLSECQRAIHFI